MDFVLYKIDGRESFHLHVIPNADSNLAALYKINRCQWNRDRPCYSTVFNRGGTKQAVHWVYARVQSAKTACLDWSIVASIDNILISAISGGCDFLGFPAVARSCLGMVDNGQWNCRSRCSPQFPAW